MMLKMPKFFPRRINELYTEEDFGSLIFGNGGDSPSGAAAFQVADENVYQAESDVELVAPGAEFPKIHFGDETLKTIRIDKRGGEFDVTYEARDRNQTGIVERDTNLLVNMLVLKDQGLALGVLTAAISTYSRSGAVSSWADYGDLTTATATISNPIVEDIARTLRKPTTEKTPYKFTSMIANSQEWILLVSIFGSAQKLDEFLRGLGITQIFVSDLQTAGKIKFVAPGIVGLQFWEGSSDVQVDAPRVEPGRETFVVKAKNRKAYAVTDPLAIWEVTGLAA